MRRLLLGLGSCLLLVTGFVTGLAAPSGAVTNTTVVFRGTANATIGGFGVQLPIAQYCAPAASQLTSTTWLTGQAPPADVASAAPLTPEAGSRVLQYAGTTSIGRGPIVVLPGTTKLTAASARVSAPSGNHSTVAVVVMTKSGAPTLYGYTGNLRNTSTSVWQTASITTATTFNWYTYTSGSWTGTARYARTLGAQEAASTSAGYQYRAGFLVGCNDVSNVLIDSLAIGTATGTTTFDFEALASGVTASASSSTVTYGTPVTITASWLDQSNHPGVEPLRVVRCQGPTCQYVTPAIMSSKSGPISFQVFPEPGWAYGVRFDGDAANSAAQANVPSFSIAPYLTVALSQRKVHVGERVTVGGVVGPCLGVARHLVIQRLVHHRWKRVGRAMAPACSVNAANQYAKLRGSIRASGIGRWQLRVVATATHGYAEADSHTLRLRVTHAPVRHVRTVHVAPPPPTSTTPDAGGTSPAPPPPV